MKTSLRLLQRLVFVLTLSCLPASASDPLTLISQQATWKYNDSGADQGTAWREAAFSDQSWLAGPAQLGFGDGDEATTISRGANGGGLIAAYFRHRFDVANPATITELNMRLLRDDGAIVYLNGVEVARQNMPAGEVHYNTLALVAVGGVEESNLGPAFAVPPALLLAGFNWLAVELHQVNVTSSDLSFALELIAGSGTPPPTNQPPTVEIATTDGEGLEISPLLDRIPDPAVFTVTRSGETTAALPVRYALSGSAVNGADYQMLSGQVTIPSGSSSTEITIDVLDDALVEGTEQVIVQLIPCATANSNALSDCYRLGQASRATAVILDNEPSETNQPPQVVVAAGSVWKYLDNGSDQGTAWRQPGFDDSTWASGPAQLGYGDGDEATVVSFGPDPGNRYITTYFRRAFVVANPASFSNLTLRLLRDDGAVVYLNGAEVVRDNMPSGDVTFQTLAGGVAADENAFVEHRIGASNLVPGQNILAVEVHQVTPVSSDMSFDLELIANGSAPTNTTPIATVRVSTSPANEEGGSPAKFVVSLSHSVSYPVPVSFALSGSASNGVDYTRIESPVTIPPGETSAFVVVTPVDDQLVEGNESVRLTLLHVLVTHPGNPPYGTGTPNSAEALIVDNDRAPTNAPATLTITAPPNGARFPVEADILVRAVANDPDDPAPLVVDFFANDQFIGRSAPVFIRAPLPGEAVMHTVAWSNAPAGEYNLVARAEVGPNGERVVSPAVHITVGNPPPPGERELHVVGVYSGITPSGGSSHNHERTDAFVVVDRPGKRVTLMLSAYEPVVWHLTVRAGTTIEQIIVGGYYEQTVEGVSPDLIARSVYASTPQNWIYVGYRVDSGELYRAIRLLNALTGLEVSSFHGDYTATREPYVIDRIQDDPRLHSTYPVPTPLGELPALNFELTFYAGAPNGNLYRRAYTLGGQTEGSTLLPAVRVISDSHGSYYSAENHGVQKIDAATGDSQALSLPADLPELSWPMGVAYDSQRGRVLLVSLGGEGFLYGYDPVANHWSLVRSMNNLDFDCLEYHAAGDAFYGVGLTYESAPVIYRLNPDGVPQGQIRLPIQPFDISPGRYQSELVSVGEYLVLLLEPRSFGNAGYVEESRMYLIDPRTGQSWLTYRHTPGRPPVIQLTSPQSGSEFVSPADVNIVAEGHDSDGWIRFVEFFADTTKLGEVVINNFQQPQPGEHQRFEFNWRNVPVGHYSLSVRATDNSGDTTVSPPVSITVRAERPAPEVSIFATRPQAFEADPNSRVLNEGIFTVRLSHAVDRLITVFYSVGGTASNGIDYREIPGRVAVAPGASSAQIIIDPVADNAVEGTETVVLTLSPGSNSSEMPTTYTVGHNDRATVLIQEGDGTGTNAVPMVTILAPDPVAAEHGLDPATFTIRRFGDTTTPLRVHYMISGTAQNAADYAEIDASVLIPSGSASANVVIAPVDDNIAEARENVILTLWLPPVLNPLPPAYRVGTPMTATAFIEDDDMPEHTNGLPVVSIQATDAFASEHGNGTNTAAFRISRTGASDQALTIWYRIEGSASNGVDYVVIQKTAVIPAGASAADVVITPLEDGQTEGLESVTLTLALPPLGVTSADGSLASAYNIGRNARAAVVIADTDDHMPACVRLPGGEIFWCLPADNNVPLRLEASSDLIEWMPLVDTIAADGAVHFADPNAPQFPVRFYRAVRR